MSVPNAIEDVEQNNSTAASASALFRKAIIITSKDNLLIQTSPE
jgi:hypothetical protein